MEKRVIAAVVACIGVMLLWGWLFPPPKHAPPPVPSPTAAAAPVAATAGSSPAPVAGTPGASPAPGVAGEAKPAAVVVPPPPAQKVTLSSSAADFILTSAGAGLAEVHLKNPKYRRLPDDQSPPGEGVLDPPQPQLLTDFPDSPFALATDAPYRVESSSPTEAVFVAEADGARVRKTYRVDEGHRLSLDVTVENTGAKALDHHLALHLVAHQNQGSKGGGFFGMAGANIAEIVCELGGKAERAPVDKLVGGTSLDRVGGVQWVAADSKFFIVAAVPAPETPPQDRKCTGRGAGDHTGEGVLAFAARSVPPGGKTSYPVMVYAGPKLVSELDQVNPGGVDANLGKAVDVTLAVISRPMLALLKAFHSVIGNWGIAIILLTLTVRLLTLPFTQRAMLSGKRMQRLGPKLAALRKKFENDKARQGQETMALYKAHGVNPLGGCLPSLIQMPIWIALYSTLNYSAELYRAPFVFWIHDLTSKDALYITPLLMGGVMFLQMRMSPAGPDAQQQKMMAMMMPVMFTSFSLFLPSGLALYMLTSYLLGIFHQLYVNRLDLRRNGPMPTS